MSGSRRHSWVKVKLHNYVCRKCGMRKVNIERQPGQWVSEWHGPDGDVAVLLYTPACAVGVETPERLAWLNDRLSQPSLPVGVSS